MYLKSIEVQGFKSFANKLKFEFREGITGIVGPNGSGKSNVSDAVRWVLGEQSAKQLRSGNMQDVIFAGTETRKPQSFASVAITFDNSDHVLDVDYEELTVARRLYRSGESEYLLNNTPVRLRDIHEIFYDTGIGQDGYSIIGQGQIDRILSGKAEERRELFDEAAGIVKFKKRKRAALKKLESEHQDLLRVSDILKELDSQIGPLEKQSKNARIYLDKRQNLKELDMNLFRIEDDRTGKQMADTAEKLGVAEADMAETREQFDRTKSEYEEVEAKLTGLDSEIAEFTERSTREALLHQQLLGQIDLLKEQIHTLEISGQQYNSRTQQIDSELARRQGDLEASEKELDLILSDYHTYLASEHKEAAALEAIDRKLAETARDIEDAKNEVIGVLQDRASVKGHGQRYGTMLEQMDIRRSEVGGRLLRLREDEQKAREESSAHDEELAALQASMEEMRKKEQTCEKRLADLRLEMASDHNQLDEMTTAFHRDSSRLESLKAMAEHYDGYGNGIRRIMEQKRRNPGIRGVVADLIDVPQEYEVAIETALGGSIRNVVTDNEATAKYLIEYLKSNKYGRATFLPLTSIKGRSFTNADALKEEGVIGVASTLVETSEEYENLKEYLLGRTLVVDNIDHAIRIGRRYRHSLYMVTLQGESFSPGGSITGGAFKNTDNLLGRKREIEELEESVKISKKKAEELRTGIENKKLLRNSIRDESAGAGEELQKLRLKSNTLQMSKKQAEEQLRLLQIDISALSKEDEELARQIREVTDKNSGVAKSLEESEHAETAVNERAAMLRSTEEQLRAEREAEAAKLEEIRLNGASLIEKKSFRESEISRLKRENEALLDEKEQIAGSLAGSRAEADEKLAQIAEVEKTVAAAEEAEKQNNERKEDLTAKRQALSDSHKEFFARRDELSERMSRLDREIFRLNAQREKLAENHEAQISYLWEEYELTPSEAREFPLAEVRTDRNAVKHEIASIKEDIKALGNINVNAIEEYKAVSERHSFLTAQHDDLVRSEETLTGIITRLDEGMRKQFSEKFAEIRVEFDKAFKELFGGGRGSIELDPDVDILEAGIHVIAHPPGKKLQNMMMLSGGEKALTAIALLFGIQNIKPSPFCLLDEIEAALDESNVVHFADYLHKLTDNTQFIVITHRRGTMTSCDRLYGITMQEKGVSTLVSVNLIEDKLSK